MTYCHSFCGSLTQVSVTAGGQQAPRSRPREAARTPDLTYKHLALLASL